MQLLRRGGHPARAKLKASQVDAAIEAIRKEQAAKLVANVQEGKRVKERETSKRAAGQPSDAPESHTQYRNETRAGWISAPEGLNNFAPTDMEGPLALLMTGQAETSWTADHSGPAVRTTKLTIPDDQPEAVERKKRMEIIDDALQLPEVPPHLGVYLRNRALADASNAADLKRPISSDTWTRPYRKEVQNWSLRPPSSYKPTRICAWGLSHSAGHSAPCPWTAAWVPLPELSPGATPLTMCTTTATS